VVMIRATIELRGKTACGMSIPPEVVAALGHGKRPPVKVTIRGYTYRSTVAVYGTEYLIGVSAENRTAAGVVAGDVVDVELELDTAPRVIDVPEDFAAALDREPAARQAFETLSYSNKSFFVIGIRDAKTAETRQRRIDKAVAQLRGDLA
jgi:Bacteriocin-protection, YdeI or OmpD-Associated/Domain of unknown function (DUF1905)